MGRPVLYVIAGHNGAGKTTLYEEVLAHQTAAPFVNADRLALERFGHPAGTEEESRHGQAAADRLRDALLAGRGSLVTESTFSHPSKLELLARARALGYRVLVYHVGLDRPEAAVERVRARVLLGGHPVPEERIRRRFERNRPLIREAVLGADRGFVFDNADSEPLRLALAFKAGRVVRRRDPLPAWVLEIYGRDLEEAG